MVIFSGLAVGLPNLLSRFLAVLETPVRQNSSQGLVAVEQIERAIRRSVNEPTRLGRSEIDSLIRSATVLTCREGIGSIRRLFLRDIPATLESIEAAGS